MEYLKVLRIVFLLADSIDFASYAVDNMPYVYVTNFCHKAQKEKWTFIYILNLYTAHKFRWTIAEHLIIVSTDCTKERLG